MLSELDKSEEELFIICKTNNATFDGEFYLGVLSTKIYCLPSCKAKMPLKKNVKYFKAKIDAVNNGLRGCKRCRSEFFPRTQPEWLDPIVEHLKLQLDKKINDEDLEIIAKVNISTIRRYFKIYLDQTVGGFHRTIRLEHAKNLIEHGESILDVPYMAGFSSVSGFRSAFIKEFDKTPGEIKNAN